MTWLMWILKSGEVKAAPMNHDAICRAIDDCGPDIGTQGIFGACGLSVKLMIFKHTDLRKLGLEPKFTDGHLLQPGKTDYRVMAKFAEIVRTVSSGSGGDKEVMSRLVRVADKLQAQVKATTMTAIERSNLQFGIRIVNKIRMFCVVVDTSALVYEILTDSPKVCFITFGVTFIILIAARMAESRLRTPA